VRRNEQDTVLQNTHHFVLYDVQCIVTIYLDVGSPIMFVLSLVYGIVVQTADNGEK
jgi:hypothetical protein